MKGSATGIKIRNEDNSPEEPVEEQPVMQLPIDGFPQFIQDFINTCSETYRTPRDYWAGAVLIATALGIGDKLELVTKYNNLPVFWLVLVGDVSSGKSHPLDLCLNYFQKRDTVSIGKYLQEMDEYELGLKDVAQRTLAAGIE